MLAHYITNICPPSCAVCRIPLHSPEEIRVLICASCQETCLPISGDCCQTCGQPLIGEIDICTICRNRQYSFKRNVAVFYYYDIAPILAAYKFQRHPRLAFFFADFLQNLYCKHYTGSTIVPVPSSRKGNSKRGFDQIALIANILRKKYSLPVAYLLRRKRSKAQKTLNYEERLQNLTGNVILKKKYVQGHIVLLDDVFTSGATLNACSNVLVQNGYACSAMTIAID